MFVLAYANSGHLNLIWTRVGLGYLRHLEGSSSFLKAGIANTLGRAVVRGLPPPLDDVTVSIEIEHAIIVWLGARLNGVTLTLSRSCIRRLTGTPPTSSRRRSSTTAISLARRRPRTCL